MPMGRLPVAQRAPATAAATGLARRFLSPDPIPGGNANSYVYPTDPITGFDLNGMCWWGCHLWHGVKKVAKAAYQHIDVSVGMCVVVCGSIGFQGGHVYVSGGQAGLSTPGANIGWNTQRYSNGSNSGIGGGLDFGAYASTPTKGSVGSRLSHGEYGLSILPGGFWGGNGHTKTLFNF